MKSVCFQHRPTRFAFGTLAASLLLASACGNVSDPGPNFGERAGATGSSGAPASAGAATVAQSGARASGGTSSAGGAQAGSTSGLGGGGASLAGAGNAGVAAGSGGAGSSSGGTNPGAGSGAGGKAAAGSGGSAASAAGAGGRSAVPYNPCPAAPTDCKIMPFGDSITDGYLAQRGGYRIPLFQRAHQEGKHLTFVGSAVNGPAMVDGVPFPQHHEGHSAYTINDEPLPAPAHKGISPFVKTSIPTYRPDIVLLMIGTNDVDNSIDLPNVPTRLGALIDSIITLDAHTLIVVAQITPTMQDPLNARIQTYNAAIPALVKSRADAGKHVALVDMYDAFVADKSYRSTLLFDRLHPNIAGFQLMADTWNTVIHDLIR
jgi:lysophospholipase L1-like esterase